MIIFDGDYSWSGKKNDENKPVSWWPGSYRLTIIDRSGETPGVRRLKPVIILAAETKEGFLVKNRYEDLVRKVCKDFNLEMDKILWTSYNLNSHSEMEIAVFNPVTRIGKEILYTVGWRPVMPNEADDIRQYIPEV